MQPKVSVITPIYNVARYLPQCLESLAAQTLQDIEFICVNDGSTDNSLDILRSYAEGDPRFVVVDKPNGGYGHTMNTGLDKARGRYIGIVESDDWIAPTAFETLVALAEQNDGCDIVKANYNIFTDEFAPVMVENYPDEACNHVMSPEDPEGRFVLNTVPAIWSAIYRKDFLQQNGIRFQETPGASYQDTGFVYKSWIAAEGFLLIHDAFLNYRIDNAGASSQSGAKVYFVCSEFAEIERYLDAHPARREKLLPTLLVRKYATYEWNYERIAWEHREEFLERIAQEFSAARDAGDLDPTLFDPKDWKRLSDIMDDAHGVYQQDLRRHKRDNLLALPRTALSKAARGSRSLATAAASAIGKPARKEDARRADVKVSIVMPAYNAAETLDEALRSLTGQTHANIEVICVDDGSTDDTLARLREQAASDARIRVLSLPHSGPSAARNRAIAESSGDYLCFVDADDFLERDAVARALEAAVANEADVVIFGIDEYLESSHRYRAMPYAVDREDVPVNTVFDPREVDNLLSSVVGFTVNKLYRSAYLKDLGLEFPDIAAHEDMPFSYAALCAARRVFVLDKVLYHYRRSQAEESRSDATDQDFEPMLQALECTGELFGRLGMADDYRRELDNYTVHMCRWKFARLRGTVRRDYYARITGGWLQDAGALGHDSDYFFEHRDRRFANGIEHGDYAMLLEHENEDLRYRINELLESKSFRLAETLAAPVRRIRGDGRN